jgi:hypothetical protein
MIDGAFGKVLDRITDPLQLLTLVFILCLFLVIKMLVDLLNRKETILEKVVSELGANSASVQKAVMLLELLLKGEIKR